MTDTPRHDDTSDDPTGDAGAGGGPAGDHTRLATYLRDHDALVTSASALADRAVRQNIGTPYETPLRTILEDIGHDHVALRSVMAVSGVEPSPVRTTASRLGELVGRLKFNGSFRGYSPSSRVLEIEGLAMLTQGRLGLWQSIASVYEPTALPDDVDVDGLQARGTDQLERLRALHVEAAGEAFADASPAVG